MFRRLRSQDRYEIRQDLAIQTLHFRSLWCLGSYMPPRKKCNMTGLLKTLFPEALAIYGFSSRKNEESTWRSLQQSNAMLKESHISSITQCPYRCYIKPLSADETILSFRSNNHPLAVPRLPNCDPLSFNRSPRLWRLIAPCLHFF